MNKVVWGIIGCGDVAERKSGPAFQKTENSQLLAVMRRNGGKARDFARRHAVPYWSDSINDLLQNPQVNYDYESFDECYGHLFYKEPFSSYHLKFQYRFTDQWMKDAPNYTYRNSGVMFHSQAPQTILKEQDWPISVEYQMLADAGDGSPRPTGNMCSPGREVFYEDEMDPRHCIESSSETYPPDEWVNAELIVYRDSLVIHKVNGEKVLEYTKPQIGGGVANCYDPEIKVDGKPLTEGYIGLQAEGQGVEFKNIMIRKL